MMGGSENIRSFNKLVEESSSTEVLVLLSGGLDSAACLHFYVALGRQVAAVFIDHGQPAADQEVSSAHAVAHHYRVPLRTHTWCGSTEKKVGSILGRNAFLLAAALMESTPTVSAIAIGVHAGTEYSDCSVAFLKTVQAVFDIYTERHVEVAAPFVEWTKPDVWEYVRSNNVPFELTYSCELGGATPCGACLSCQDREALHAHS